MKKQLCFRKWWIYLGVFIGLSGLAACGKEEPPPVAEEVYEESIIRDIQLSEEIFK